MTDKLSISADDLNPGDDRFDRFKLIGWWDQQRLRSARVLVIGAGALGNEIIKNLALLGVGNVVIADKDTIENSNLSRSVLYREADAGRSKAVVAAAAARDIYPAINATALAAWTTAKPACRSIATAGASAGRGWMGRSRSFKVSLAFSPPMPLSRIPATNAP